MYFSAIKRQRAKLRTIIKKLERIKDEFENPNIKELLENARVDLANALNISNAFNPLKVHSMRRAKVLRLIVAGKKIKTISVDCKVSERYVSLLMRENNINRYQPRKSKCL